MGLIEELLCKACLNDEHEKCTKQKCFCFVWYRNIPQIHNGQIESIIDRRTE